MLKRRNIREAAIQFLYLADLESGPDASEMQEAFWEMIQENSLKKLNQAKAKAILHVTQGRESRILKLGQLASDAESQLKAAGVTPQITQALRQLLTQEDQLSESILRLKSRVESKSNEPIPGHLIQAVADTNDSLIQARLAWLEQLADEPDFAQKLEELNASITHLGRISQRLASIDDPESSIGDFAHLRDSSADLLKFREQTQALITSVLEHKEAIDHALAAVIENYAPQRVDPVDRAILRLATNELQMSNDIPRAVTINEAIEIAKKYGSSDSARFINGVLDAV
jgi:transcription antitermination factor NusB